MTAERQQPRCFRISALRPQLQDTWSMELVADDGGEVDALPGQFNMLYAFGAGEAPISVSRIGGHRLVHSIRAVGRVTQALRLLQVGDAVGLRGPFGVAWPIDQLRSREVIVVAGGLGMAPLRPVIDAALADRGGVGRVQLFYGSRDPDYFLYRNEFEGWRERDIEVNLTVDRADPTWHGPVGVVTRLLDGASFDSERSIALVCGPEVMMRFAVASLLHQGLMPEQIYLSVERNMQCGTGHCGHCQLGPFIVCRDGPVFRYDQIAASLTVREL